MVGPKSTNPPHTYRKRGVYYFYRKVPKDLRSHYSSPKLVKSLRTRSHKEAARSARLFAAKLDQLWLETRLNCQLNDIDDWLKLESGAQHQSSHIHLSDALELYVKTKSVDRSAHFERSARRYIQTIIDCLGDRPVDLYSSKDAVEYRNWLTSKGLSKSSVLRTFNSAKAVFNFTINELGLSARNPFSGTYLPSVDDAVTRIPIKGPLLSRIQHACVEADDEVRWLVALLSDTGMRLAEAAGLLVSDIVLDHEIPHIRLVPHYHRSLKTQSSQRLIPLCGASLWAAERVVANVTSDYCFTRYNQTSETNSNSASAAINKWLKPFSSERIVLHGMRHGMRDRLRDVDTPTEVIDQIGGWTLQSIGQSYGEGYSLETLHRWMSAACNNR